MKLSFNGLERCGSWLKARRCRRRNWHDWHHTGAEYHHDSSETHYFTCTTCGRVENDLSDNWKYLKTEDAQHRYCLKHGIANSPILHYILDLLPKGTQPCPKL